MYLMGLEPLTSARKRPLCGLDRTYLHQLIIRHYNISNFQSTLGVIARTRTNVVIITLKTQVQLADSKNEVKKLFLNKIRNHYYQSCVQDYTEMLQIALLQDPGLLIL